MSKNYELEYLKLENAKLKEEIKNASNFNPNDILGILNLASDMRYLLERCRGMQIPIDLARSIDDVLSRARDYDE